MSTPSVYQAALKRDRFIIVAAMVLLAALAWAYTWHIAVHHEAMAGAMSMPHMSAWSGIDFVYMFLMWAVMMFAMMLPSVTPTVLIYARVRANRDRATHR